jgi:small subunit ribosomal protein S9
VAQSEVYFGTGRRKSSVARVRLKPGSGSILINRKELKEYFPTREHQVFVTAPLRRSESEGKYDIVVRASGGGITGQAGAILMGIARALVKVNPSLEGALRDAGHLTRDSRMKERKKYGQRGARRSFQFSKR